MPYHNPVVLASEIAVADILLDGRRSASGAPRLDAAEGGPALTPESRERYEESVELLFTALENERFSYHGKHFQIADSGIVPARPEVPVFLGGTSDRTYELAAERGWAVVAAAASVRGARRAARPLPRQVRRARQRAGHRLDPRLLHRRGSGRREA